LTPSILVEGLQRNFNGIPHADFAKLLDHFFAQMKWSLTDTVAGYHNTFVELMKSSLQEHHTAELNYFHSRYIMAIDPTDNETAIWLLFELGICDRATTKICYSADFSSDASDISQCAVILKVKNAMENGNVVIMINSQSINSCFYDVFNCYFEVITATNGEPQRFANLAVGSYSQRCKVHENFKIILHVPASSLPSVPLPLLNRFEKYFVSVEHALKYTLKDSPKVASVFDAISDGCADFVSQVHTFQSQSRLLYGYFAKETISSLVFDFAMRTKKLKSSIPEIPNSFRLNNTVPVDTDAQPSNTDFNLRAMIRKANFHLLQLARPEYIFFCRQLPANYVHEYMLEQEHLSIIRFFHHAITNLATLSPPPAPRSFNLKWCVFTRTTGELLRLCSDDKLQQLFTPKLRQGLRIDFLELSSVQSVESCKEIIKEASKQAMALICVANMNVCTVSHVNVCRHLISKYLSRTNIFVTLILHYPPEMNLSDQPNYHAIYVDEWSFVYIDSIGITTGHENNMGVLDVDARSWLAKGFGLSIEIPENTLVEPFASRFFENLKQCCGDMVIHPKSHKLSHSKAFYSHTDVDTRFRFLSEIFNSFPFLMKEILHNFSKTWTPALLYAILSEECEQIQLGRTANSLLHRMHSSIKGALFPLVVHIMRNICSNFALEAIAAIGDDTDKQELLRLIVKTFTPPPLKDIQDQNLDQVVTVYSQFPFPSQTVLFDVLSEQLLTSLRIATYGASTDEEVRTKFKNYVKSAPISSAVNFINTHPKLLLSFKQDFVVRTLQLPQMRESWNDLFVSFLDRLDCGSDVISLYLSVHLHGSLLSTLSVLLHPLLEMKEPEDFVESMKRRFGSFGFEQDVERICLATLDLSVETLWKRLLGMCSGNSAVLTENWLYTFHQFHLQRPHHNALIGILSVEQLLRLDIMTIIFYFVISTNQYKLAVGEVVRTTASVSTQSSQGSISRFLPLLTALCNLSRDLSIGVPSIVSFLQEVSTYFLKVNKGYMTLSVDKSENLARDFGSLIALWTSVGITMWSAVPALWKVRTIFVLLQNNNISDRMCAEACEFIKKNNANFKYTPKLLHEKHCMKSNPNTLVEDAIFFSLLHKKQEENQYSSIDDLCELYSSTPSSNEVRVVFDNVVFTTVILSKIATTLGKEPNYQFTDASASICKSIIAESPTYGLYLLQQVHPRDSLCALVKSNTLSQLGLDSWKVNGDIFAMKPLHFFSFMIEEQTELGRFYHQTLRYIQQGKDYLLKAIQESRDISIIRQYRMCIFLACYYEYYNKLTKCHLILSLLERSEVLRLLDITPQEKLIFKMVADVPKNWDPIDPLLFQFSYKARLDKNDNTIAHLMMNCMAVALGCPRDSNHIYMRAFDISKAAASLSPGSTLNRKMADSGYLLQNDGSLTPSDVMGNHTPFRLVLNTLVWASFSWSCVIDPVNGPKVCKSINNFLTNWEEDKKITPVFGFSLRNRNEREKIRFCIFFSLLLFFVTQHRVIYFWRYAFADPGFLKYVCSKHGDP
jgi:hypothetical protein